MELFEFHTTLPLITTEITKIPFTWCLLQFTVQSLVQCALFAGKLSSVIRDRLYIVNTRVRVPSPGLILSLVSPCLRIVTVSVRGSASLESSVHLVIVSWRVIAVTYPVHSIHLYIVSKIWKYCFYRQHHNYLYTCLPVFTKKDVTEESRHHLMFAVLCLDLPMEEA